MRVVLVVCALLAGCGEVVKTQPDAPIDADPCATNTCECTPETEATDCGQYEVCDVSGSGRVCACAPAYAEMNGACVFAGAPADRGMAELTTWQISGTDITLDPSAAGNVDGGEASIGVEGVCSFASLTQTFTMPPRARSQPFKIAITHTADDPVFPPVLSATTLQVRVGNQWFDMPVSRNVYRTDTFCLGESAYGGDVEFAVSSFGATECGQQTAARIRVDQIAVRVADPGECPEPGAIPNGDFEAASNWTFTTGGTATAAITATDGEGTSRGALLSLPDRCARASMVGAIAVPSGAGRALEVYTRGSGSSSRVAVKFADRPVATLQVTTQARSQRICIPSWAQGTTLNLTLATERSQDNTCSAAPRQIAFDNIRIVDEPTCMDGPLTDPGFERITNVTGPATGWVLNNDVVNNLEPGIAQVLNSAPSAQTGSGSLRLSTNNECASSPSAAVAFTVPAAVGSAGPAVKVFGNAPANPRTTPFVALGLGAPLFTFRSEVPETGSYVEVIRCIPPALSGRRLDLFLTMQDDDGGACQPAMPPPTESVAYDSVSVTTDPSCPAQ